MPLEDDHHGGRVIDLAISLAGTLNPPEVIQRLLERALGLVRADRVTLSRLTSKGLRIEATYGSSGELTWVGREYELDLIRAQPLVWQAISDHRPVFGGRLKLTTAAPEFKTALGDVQHTAVMPLVEAGEANGLLVFSRRQDVPFGGEDLPTLQLISSLASLALRNARLFAETETMRRSLELAVEAAKDVGAQSDLATVFASLLRQALQAVNGDQGSLARVEGHEMVIEFATGPVPVGSRWPVAPEVLRAVRDGRSVQMTAAEYGLVEAEEEKLVKRYYRFLIAPLQLPDEPRELLALARYKDVPFSAEEVQSLTQVSALGSLLLRNARLLERARQAERSMSEFLSIAAHELRTPLGVVAGYAELLETSLGPPPAQAIGPLQAISRKAAEALNLVEELLLAARLEEHALTLNQQPFDLSEVAEAAVNRAQPRARVSESQVVLGGRGPDALVLGDSVWAGRILDNLINNAISYSEAPAEVSVRLSVRPGSATARVSDRGLGIPEEEQSWVFNRFARGRASRAPGGSGGGSPESGSGTGLGLYIGRSLARLMGGDLVLEASRPGEGSTFALTLPAHGSRLVLSPARGGR
jgi:signal transduction histidine kinase